MDFETFWMFLISSYGPQAGTPVQTAELDITSSKFKERLKAAWDLTIQEARRPGK